MNRATVLLLLLMLVALSQNSTRCEQTDREVEAVVRQVREWEE